MTSICSPLSRRACKSVGEIACFLLFTWQCLILGPPESLIKTIQKPKYLSLDIVISRYNDIYVQMFDSLSIGLISLIFCYETLLDTRHNFGQVGLNDVVVSPPALFIIRKKTTSLHET